MAITGTADTAGGRLGRLGRGARCSRPTTAPGRRAMADWATITSAATAAGTFALAVSTVLSTRSANQAARVAERSMLASLRPLVLASRHQDPPEKVTWLDLHPLQVPGGQAVIEETDGVTYFAVGLRNAGNGVAVLHGWYMNPREDATFHPHPEPEEFRRLTRDLYIPAGDTGFCQGAFREADDPDREELHAALVERRRIGLDILYGDHEGGQRTITRLGLMPTDSGAWLATTARHWNLDRIDPR